MVSVKWSSSLQADAACNNIIQFMKTTCKLRHYNPKLETLSF